MPLRDWVLLLPLVSVSACLVPGLEVGESTAGTSGAAGHGGVIFFADGGATAAGGAGGAGGAAGTFGSQSGAGGVSSGAGGDAPETGGRGPLHCDDRPIPPKSEWKVSASNSSKGSLREEDPLFNPPEHAVDGSLSERWSIGLKQEAVDQWFHIDFGREVAVSELTLQQGVDLDDYPRGYAISMSNRHTDFDAQACIEGKGSPVSESVIPLGAMAVGRYLLIKQTGTGERWWSIAELDVACHE